MKRAWVLFFGLTLFTVGIMLPPFGDSHTLNLADESCEECHSEFEPFQVVIDAPSEVPAAFEFDYKVIVQNNGEHEVQNLEAIIDLSEAQYLDTILEGGEPYHDEVTSSVAFRQTVSFSFPVTRGANLARVILDGDDGIINDLDMTVTGPNGDTTSSANSGADEAVQLRAREIRSWGYGDYTVEIVWFVGSPTISFTLTMDVEYGADQIVLDGENLAPGQEFTFSVPLTSTDKGDNMINVAITGTAHYEHKEEDDSVTTDSYSYTIDKSSELTVGNRFVYTEPDINGGGSINVLLMERVLGLLSAFGLMLSLAFSSLFYPVYSRVEKFVGGGAKRVKWHCRISQGILGISLIHGILLPFSPHASNLRGLLPGTSAFLIMGVLGYVGWKQNVLRPRWGNDRWKRVHLILSILAVIIVIAHAFMDGTDFAWLR
jgi:hypothetical protein